MNIFNYFDNPKFYGRRKGRKLSKSAELAIIEGQKYLIKIEDLTNIFSKKNIILEIGFGDGENLINSAKINSNFFYIGADPFLNSTAKCLNKLLKYNLKNIVKNGLNAFSNQSFSGGSEICSRHGPQHTSA